MALDWHIATGSDTPIYRQIADQVRRAVVTGSCRPGDALPSVRGLAEQLVVNPNTVVKAFNELARDGLVEARPGRGYFVTDRRQVYSKAERMRRLDRVLETLISEALVLDFSPAEIRAALDGKLVPFETRRPDPSG